MVQEDASGVTYYGEHCGMLTLPEYTERWERKLGWYREQDVLPLESGDGEGGTLIVTRDDQHGGFSSNEIKQFIEATF
jgi:hypothetical protein